MLFTFSYCIPMLLIIYYYSQICKHVFTHEKALRTQAKKMNIESLRTNTSSTTAEVRIARAAITICFLFVAGNFQLHKYSSYQLRVARSKNFRFIYSYYFLLNVIESATHWIGRSTSPFCCWWQRGRHTVQWLWSDHLEIKAYSHQVLQCFRRVHVNLLPVLIPMYMPSVIRNIGKRIREFIVDVHSDGGGGGVMCVASDISVIVCHSIHFLFFPILSLSLSLPHLVCSSCPQNRITETLTLAGNLWKGGENWWYSVDCYIRCKHCTGSTSIIYSLFYGPNHTTIYGYDYDYDRKIDFYQITWSIYLLFSQHVENINSKMWYWLGSYFFKDNLRMVVLPSSSIVKLRVKFLAICCFRQFQRLLVFTIKLLYVMYMENNFIVK